MDALVPKSVRIYKAGMNNIVTIVSVLISFIGILFLNWEGKEVVALFVTNLMILLFSGAFKIVISHANKDFASGFFLRMLIFVFYLIFGAVVVAGIGDYILPKIVIENKNGLFSYQNQIYILLASHLIDTIYWIKMKKYKSSFAWKQALFHLTYFFALYKILEYSLKFVNSLSIENNEIQKAALLILFIRILFEIFIQLINKIVNKKFPVSN